MSWNIRTWGTHDLRQDDLWRIVNIILESQVDIVCIQELQCGHGTPFKVNAPISQRSLDAVGILVDALASRDDGALWRSNASGVNYAKSKKMRDAYAFLWKMTPAKSNTAHGDPVDGIEDLFEPQILESNTKSEFPGRRPALFSVGVYVGKTITPVNIISYHAMTPCQCVFYRRQRRRPRHQCIVDAAGSRWLLHAQQKRLVLRLPGGKPPAEGRHHRPR